MTGAGPDDIGAESFSLRELVERFGGECGGDLDRRVSGFATLRSAGASDLAFVTAARYRSEVSASNASAVLVTAADAALLESHGARLWVCRDPYLQFAKIAQYLEAKRRTDVPPSIDPTARIAPDARVDPSATVAAFTTVGAGALIGARVRIGAGSHIGAAARIGDDSLVHPAVVIYPGCRIGTRCIIHAGAVIGADGFGFAKEGSRWVKIPQTGGVVVGDDVEIGANTTIDRGALDDTRIGNGVKLDNQIQVGHNVQIGDDTIMAAFVGIAGSAIIGKRCLVGGAARIMGHVSIVDDTVISTQTFVSRSITKPGQYTGYYPMAEHASFERSAAVLRRLDGMRERIRRLEAGSQTNPEPERPA